MRGSDGTSGFSGFLSRQFLSYALTGLAAFAASAAYTNYRMVPERNLTLIPLSFERVKMCRVNRVELRNRLQSVSFRPLIVPHQSETERVQLAALAALQSDARSAEDPSKAKAEWFVDARAFEPVGLAELKAQGVIVCTPARAADGKPDHRYGTQVRVQALVLMDSPATYSVDRDCTLGVRDPQQGLSKVMRIPMKAYTSPGAYVAAGVSVPQGEVPSLTLRRSGELSLVYDESRARDVDQGAFNDLVDRTKRDQKWSLIVSIDCKFVSSRGKESLATDRVFEIRNGKLAQSADGQGESLLSGIF
jgi:hypothetical protein